MVHIHFNHLQGIRHRKRLGNADIDESSDIPEHQRCTANTLTIMATIDILEAENDGVFKGINQCAFGKCQSIFNKQNLSSKYADKIEDILRK